MQDAVRKGALSPRELPDQALCQLGSELALAQEALLGLEQAEAIIPLPMPNVVYLLLALLQKEANARGAEATTWRAFRILGELHRDIETEAMNRFLNLQPPIPSRDIHEALSAANK